MFTVKSIYCQYRKKKRVPESATFIPVFPKTAAMSDNGPLLSYNNLVKHLVYL